MKSLESNGKFNSVIQGELWKLQKVLYPYKVLIPYFLYTDDFGINNPLGSKSNRHSICNFYYNVPCLPNKTAKQTDVFLVCSIKSSDIKNMEVTVSQG